MNQFYPSVAYETWIVYVADIFPRFDSYRFYTCAIIWIIYFQPFPRLYVTNYKTFISSFTEMRNDIMFKHQKEKTIEFL